MVIKGLTPNVDSFLFCEVQDEHRNFNRFPIVLFVVVEGRDGDMIGVVIRDKDNQLAMPMGRIKIVRDEPNSKPKFEGNPNLIED